MVNKRLGKFIREIFSFLIALIGIVVILGIVNFTYPELPVGETTGQLYFLAWGGITTCILLISMILLSKRSTIHFNFPTMVSWILICLGIIQAVWGFRQIYGFTHSNHSLFSLTGSFFNPGPYSGYLAMVLPICLYEFLSVKNKKTGSYLNQLKYYVSLAGVLLLLCILPAGMSRSAWIAAAISCCIVCGHYYSWGELFVNAWNKHRLKILFISIFIILAVFISSVFLFSIKKDSANGRLFMWKISTISVMQKPLTGYGHKSFASAYGNAQETYFASANFSESEELVAGSPEYAFNEYLQIAMEWGIPVLIVFLLIIFFSLYIGFKKQRIGICGAIISLLIFAVSSYPFQLPVFVITFIFLLTACVLGKSSYGLGAFALFIGCIGLYLHKNNVYDECCKWSKSRMLYQVGSYELAIKKYAELYPALKIHPAFLFEYGHAHHKLGNYEQSTEIMVEAARYSCDPMIFNIIGKNHQSLSDYNQAEHWFKRSINRLPGRIYPYYLLAKLYAEPEFYQIDKLEEMAEVVLTKEPKVQSTAIRQMREEIKTILYK